MRAEPQLGLPAKEERQHPDAGRSLGDHGGQGGSPHAHAQAEDQDRVQDDVGQSADQDREHAGLGKALGGDKGVHAQGQLDEDRPQGINVHVADPVFHGVFAGAEGQEERAVKEQQDGGQDDGDHDLQDEAVPQDGLRLLVIPLAHVDGGAGSAAVAD